MEVRRPKDVEGNSKRAVEEYTSREVARVEVEMDPGVNGALAIRAWFPDGTHLDFMAYAVIDAACLEEVVFKTWPPKSPK